MGELATFGMEDLKKKVAEETQARFGALIPAEAFQKMVDAAIKEFFETPVTFTIESNAGRSGYDSRYNDRVFTHITPFKVLVWTYLHKESIKMLDELFRSKENAASQTIVKALQEDQQLNDVIEIRAAQLAGIFASVQSKTLQASATSHLLRAMMSAASQNNDHNMMNALANAFNQDGTPKNTYA